MDAEFSLAGGLVHACARLPNTVSDLEFSVRRAVTAVAKALRSNVKGHGFEPIVHAL